MILYPDNANQPNALQEAARDVGVSGAKFAIFGIPKPFTDPTIDLIQKNAIASWKELGDDVDVILMGTDEGVEEAARDFEVLYSPEIALNEQGTPLLSDAFRVAHEMTDAEILIYCNCDVILLKSLTRAVELVLKDDQFKSFVAFGRRTDLQVNEEVDFADPRRINGLIQEAKTHGNLAPIVCKEYFAFTRDMYQEVPEFAVGRGNWDNWMIAHAKSLDVPVVDLSDAVSVIHQSHDYRHADSTRFECYVSGTEAKNNEELAGGKNIIGGSTGTWKLGADGLKRNKFAWMNRTFWMDLHRFVQMVVRLPFQK